MDVLVDWVTVLVMPTVCLVRYAVINRTDHWPPIRYKGTGWSAKFHAWPSRDMPNAQCSKTSCSSLPLSLFRRSSCLPASKVASFSLRLEQLLSLRLTTARDLIRRRWLSCPWL